MADEATLALERTAWCRDPRGLSSSERCPPWEAIFCPRSRRPMQDNAGGEGGLGEGSLEAQGS